MAKHKIESARLLSVGECRARPGWRMTRHLHPFHELIVVMGGRLCARIAGRRVEAGPGEVLFYRAALPHEEWTPDDQPVRSLFVSFEWPDCPRRLADVTFDARGRIRQAIGWLREDADLNHPVRGAAGDAALRLMLAELAQAASAEGRNDLVERTRRAMRRQLDQPLDLARLATGAGMSKFHFLRRYKAQAGVTPISDLRRIRLEFARNLILTSNLPLKAVAPRAGLGDVQHMTRLFRRYLGITPGELRKDVRAG